MAIGLVKRGASPEWAIIYDDLSVFSVFDGPWKDAPAWGVQAIVYRSKETGWSIATDGDYFCKLSDGSFLPLGPDSLMDYSANVWHTIKVGRMISRDEFGAAMGKAREIMINVKKTGAFRSERIK